MASRPVAWSGPNREKAVGGGGVTHGDASEFRGVISTKSEARSRVTVQEELAGKGSEEQGAGG